MRSRGAFAEFLLEQLQHSEEKDSPGTASGSSMSESEREDLRHHLEETLGEREVTRALLESREKKKRKRSKKKKKRRATTKSIGSISGAEDSDEGRFSEPESMFSLGTALNKGLRAGGALLQRGESIVEEEDAEAEEGEGERGKRSYEIGRDLIRDEIAETHRVKFAVYVYYAKAVGAALSIAGIVFYGCFQVGVV